LGDPPDDIYYQDAVYNNNEYSFKGNLDDVVEFDVHPDLGLITCEIESQVVDNDSYEDYVSLNSEYDFIIPRQVLCHGCPLNNLKERMEQ
jgi:hypothetical protein